MHTCIPFTAILASLEARSAAMSVFRQAVDKLGFLKFLTKCKKSNTLHPVNQPHGANVDTRKKHTVVEDLQIGDEMIEASRTGKKIRQDVEAQKSNATSRIGNIESGRHVSKETNEISCDLPLCADDAPMTERSFYNSKTSNARTLPVATDMDVSDSKSKVGETCSKNSYRIVSSVEDRNNATQILCLNELINSYGNVLSRYSCSARISTRTLNQNGVGVNLTTGATQEVDRQLRDRPFQSKISAASACDSARHPNAPVAVDNVSIPIASHQDVQHLNAKAPKACELDSILDLYNAYEMNKMDIDDPIVRCLGFKRNELKEGCSEERLTRFYVYGMSPAKLKNTSLSH